MDYIIIKPKEKKVVSWNYVVEDSGTSISSTNSNFSSIFSICNVLEVDDLKIDYCMVYYRYVGIYFIPKGTWFIINFF